MSDGPAWAMGFATFRPEGRECVATTFRRDAETEVVEAQAFSGVKCEVWRMKRYPFAWCWGPVRSAWTDQVEETTA